MPAHSLIFALSQVSRAAIVRRAILLPPAAALLLVLARTVAGRAAPFQTKAPYALLVDYTTGAVLFEKRADAPVAPKSTTKILTAEIVFRDLAEGKLRLQDRMAISPRAAREGDAESGGSSMFARANTQISVDDLLRGLLIPVGQRRRHRSRRRHRRLGKRVRGAHEPGSPPVGHEPFAIRQRLGVGQCGAAGDRARHGASGGLCDRHLSAVLPLFR